MSKRLFDDKFLLAYSEEHIAYEIDMFFSLVEMLSGQIKIAASSPDEMKRLNFALIESFGVHTRNLIDFLYCDNPRPTDIVACDYFADWKSIRPSISPNLETAKKRADKELAHLTTDRIAGTPPGKKWPFAELAKEVKPLLESFVKNPRTKALSPVVAKAIH